MSLKFKIQSSKFETEDLKLKIKLGAVFIFTLFAVAACVKTESKRNEFVIADSKSYEASLFRANCVICHGNEANGKEINGVLTPSLRYGEAAKLTEEQIYTQIHDGKLPMPAFKNQLTESEIKRMVQFIQRDLQGKQETEKPK